MNNRHPWARDCPRRRGFVLAEVMVAVVLLSVFVVFLASAVQRACDSSVRLREATSGLSDAETSEATGDAWDWGPSVETVAWSPGPELLVSPNQDCVPVGSVGAWVDGWQVGEWPVSSTTGLELKGGIWDGMAGLELVVRVRIDEGPWGPPYRTVVPDTYGGISGEAASASEAEHVADGFADATVVSHARSSGTSSLTASWAETPIAKAVNDVVLILQSPTAGLCGLDCEGRVQSWVFTESRELDVYW